MHDFHAPYDQIKNELLSYHPFKRWGYILIQKGRVVDNHIGTDGIKGLWAGGEYDILVELIRKRSINLRKGFLVFKCDTADTLTNHAIEVCTKHDFVIMAVSKRKNWKSDTVFLLPTAYCRDYIYPRSFDLSRTPWGDRIPKVVWRGQTTGIERWNNEYRGTRKTIVERLTNEVPELVDVGFTRSHITNERFEMKPVMTIREQSEYKAVLVMDGWGWPGSIQWSIDSGSIPIVISEIELDLQRFLKDGVNCFFAAADGSDVVDVVRKVLSLSSQEATLILRSLASMSSQELNPASLTKRLDDVLVKAGSGTS